MNELLQRLLEAEILSEDTKAELEGAFKTQLDEAIAAAKDEAAADVRAELSEQWVQEKDTLIEAIDTKVGDFLETELDELKGDIENFRDLEAEYADKLVEAKAAMADELKGDMSDLVEQINHFLEIRLSSEIEELREDIEVVRQNEFGRKIFEAFSDEFTSNYADEQSAEFNLRETEARLTEAEDKLATAERKLAEQERKEKMATVLSPLSGRARDVMEAILNKVDVNNLEEAYKVFIGRVLRESTDTTKSEKEDKVLAESEDNKNIVEDTIVVTGDKEDTLTESVAADPVQADKLAHLRRLAGIA